MNEPLVSVVIPTYNSARFLPRTLEAVLGQSHPAHEVIVVDDGSTDNTQAVIEPFLDRVTYHRQPNFGGPSGPRNVGIQLAKGEFVAFCDSDDILKPDSLADAVAAFSAFPQIDFIWGDYEVIDEQDEVQRSRGMDTYQDFRASLHATDHESLGIMEPGTTYRWLLRGLFMGISAVVVRRKVLIDAGPFDETLKNSDDREMWLRVARGGACFAYLDRIRFSYRKHSGSVTNRGYLRMPSVISNLERQIPFIEQPADLDYVRRRINRCRLGYAWGLRLNGDLDQAEAAYRHALAEARTWQGLKGLMLTKLAIMKKTLAG